MPDACLCDPQVVQLRAQLDAAVIARHVAEREVAALHIQKAHEALRIKVGLFQLSQWVVVRFAYHVIVSLESLASPFRNS